MRGFFCLNNTNHAIKIVNLFPLMECIRQNQQNNNFALFSIIINFDELRLCVFNKPSFSL